MSDLIDPTDLDDGVSMELIHALRCPRGWRWFASTDVMADVWPVGPAVTMSEALDSLLCQIFANHYAMPRSGEVVVCLGRRIRKADLEDGFSDDLAWVIETDYAIKVRLRLDRKSEERARRDAERQAEEFKPETGGTEP